MKNIIKIIPILLLCATIGCEMDLYPDNSITAGQISTNPDGAEYVTIGTYSMFKDVMTFRQADATGNTYIRHYFQSTEFKGDNISISKATSDEFYANMTYRYTPDNTPTSYLWYAGYKMVTAASGVVEVITDGTSAELDQLKGENLFIRALVNLHLVTLFAEPYYKGRENMGIVLRTSAVVTETKRATVGEVYDRIVLDLKDAARLMTINKGAGYASKEAAYGLLSRVYLYMEDFPKAIQAANDCLALRPESNLEPAATLKDYFGKALQSTETLFAVACASLDDRGTSSIGSMYLKDGTGWGEIFASQPLRNVFNKNPQDKRLGFIRPKYLGADTLSTVNNSTAMFNYFGEATGGDITYITSFLKTVYYFNGDYYDAQNGGGNKATAMADGKYSMVVVGETKVGYITPNIDNDRETGYPIYYNTKFSYQDGNPMLSSPVMLRLAEVILNRAEAKLRQPASDVAGATTDINIVRSRAGIPALATVTLDDILDERRMELCFEGHRAFDLIRNNKAIDRYYPGEHPAELIEPSNPRNVYYIPNMEVEVSGIPQNP